MNMKRFGLACGATLIFTFMFDFVTHTIILKRLYELTATHWRSESDMQAHFIWMIAGQVLFAAGFCAVYVKGTGGGSLRHGAGYGFLMGVFLSGTDFIVYAAQPLPLRLIGAWIIADTLKLTIAGALFAGIYRGKGRSEAVRPVG
jgi:hypothetical protein